MEGCLTGFKSARPPLRLEAISQDSKAVSSRRMQDFTVCHDSLYSMAFLPRSWRGRCRGIQKVEEVSPSQPREKFGYWPIKTWIYRDHLYRMISPQLIVCRNQTLSNQQSPVRFPRLPNTKQEADQPNFSNYP